MSIPMKLRRWLFGSVRRALLLLPLVVLLPVLLFQGWFFLQWIRHEQDDEVQWNLEVARSFGAMFESHLRSVLAEEAAVGAVLASAEASPVLRASLLRAAVEQHPSWRDLLWTEPSGRVVAAARAPPERQVLGDQPFFRTIREGRDWALSDLFPSPAGGRPLFAVARGVRDSDGKLRGVVTALVDPSLLGRVLAVQRGSGGTVLLLDRRGALVFRHPWLEPAGREWLWAADFARERQTLLTGRETWFVAVSPLDGKRRTFAAVPLPNLGWVALATRPVSLALAPALSEIRWSLPTLVLVAATALWLAHLVGNAVAKPAARLQQHAEAVGRGEFQRRLGGEAPRELQLVADTLNRMAAQLEDRERERRQALEGLRESEERLRLSSEAADIGVWDWDVDRNALSWDPRCKAIMGVPPEAEPSYDLFRAALHPEDRRATEEAVERALGSGGDYEAEYRALQPDGQVRWVLARGRVLGGSPRGSRRMLGVAMDITRRKEYEGALARAQAAELGEQAKSEFMALASHELHTPLNVIVGYADLLLDEVDGPLNPEQKKSLRRLAESGRRLTRIADALLDLSRLRAGDLALGASDFDLRELLATGVTPYEERARVKGLELTWSVAPDVSAVLRGDDEHLLQALGVLLDNAVKFTDRGAVAVTVAKEREFHGHECLRFAVTDTGPGIPPEQQALIFGPFRQAEAPDTRTHDGLGLGLSIGSALVAQMGGHIGIDSEPGRGSTFSFTACFELAEEVRT